MFGLKPVGIKSTATAVLFFMDCSEWVITNTLHFKDCSGVPSDIYGTNYVYSSGGGGQNGNSSNSNSTSDSAFANIRDTLDLDCLKHVIRDYINNRFFNSQLSQNFLPFLQALDTLQGFEMTILFKDEVLPIHDLGDEIAMEHHGFHNPGYTSLIRISNQLETATQEIIISTAVHEVLHSYLRAVRQYCLPIFRGGGDGNPDNFPFMARFYQLDSLGYKQNIWHELIAENFINVIVDAIQAFNPSYPKDRAYALAWGGLHETDAYENATDKPTIPFILDVNNQEKLVSESSQGIPCD
ncbi:MAG TPA: hypothetical protein PKE06_18325 [Flavilitoribacter sp.]|nr:hypothetical protein [Flavilitoribacter sp.]HMQ90498.1 hypothetical protein [Flavilitoribacter sp.]